MSSLSIMLLLIHLLSKIAVDSYRSIHPPSFLGSPFHQKVVVQIRSGTGTMTLSPGLTILIFFAAVSIILQACTWCSSFASVRCCQILSSAQRTHHSVLDALGSTWCGSWGCPHIWISSCKVNSCSPPLVPPRPGGCSCAPQAPSKFGTRRYIRHKRWYWAWRCRHCRCCLSCLMWRDLPPK